MNTSDPTEGIRRIQQALINTDPALDNRATVEREFGQAWDTDELMRDFEVQGFMAPYVVVKRRLDGVVGSLMFKHSPRIYFNFTPDAK